MSCTVLKRNAGRASLVLLLAALWPGCALPGQRPADNVGETFALCGPNGSIDDCEDGDGRIKEIGERGGYWYTFCDRVGTTIVPDPSPGSPFVMTASGANGSKFAARMQGQVASQGSPLYGGMALNLTDPKGPYDASKYKGVAFWAKKGPEGSDAVRFKVPDGSTDEAGGVCSDCSNDFGVDLTLSESWQQFAIPWRKLKQQPNWGSPRPHAIKPAKIYSLQWQVSRPGASFDVWVDDVEFIGCD